MRVVILHDRVCESSTADDLDALAQAAVVSDALAALGHAPVTLPFSLDLGGVTGSLRALAPDLVFNLVESTEGQGRLIHLAPALLEALGVPFTGAGAEAMYLTSGKLLAKRLLAAAGVDTPAWITPNRRADEPRSASFQPGRYILKSVWEHASRGLGADAVGAFDSAGALRAELVRRAPRLAGEGFAEQYIEGREFNLSVLSREPGAPAEVLPPAEIDFVGYADDRLRIVDYRAKWDDSSYEFHHTPRRFDFPREDAPLLVRLADLALRCWDLFNLRGHARVDFRVDSTGRPWALEVNANPCLSPDAGFAAALERAGIPFSDAVRRILTDVPGRPHTLPYRA